MATPRFNHLSLLMMMGIVVLALTMWSLITQPMATLLATLPHLERFEHQLEDTESPTAWWHMRLILNGGGTQAAVVASASDQAGDGHQLQWDPRSLVWRLIRSGPGPQILAQGQVASMPRRLSVYRFGFRLEVRIDGQLTATTFDFADTPPAQRWILENEYPGLNHRLEIHNHLYLASATVADDAQYAEFVTFLESFRHHQYTDQLLLQQASNLIAYFQEAHHSQTHLWSWLMWAYGSSLIERGHAIESGALDGVVDYLRVAGNGDGPSEIPGLLMDLQARAAQRAQEIPETPTPAETFVNKRRSWLQTVVRIQDILDALSGRGESASGNHFSDAHDRFIGHMCRQVALIMSGQEPAANPAEAPSWLTARVRGLSGRLPIDPPFPELPREWLARSWQRPTMDRLLSLSGGPNEAQSLRARALLLQAAAAQEPLENPQAHAFFEPLALPARQRTVSMAILAIHGIIPINDALSELSQPDADGISLQERDPLAYALYRLLLHRRGAELAEAEWQRPNWALPPGLTPYHQLLDGGYGATIIAFSRPGDTIPPNEALASALAMQEVSGIRPQWSLLKGLPSMTLPLSLLIPPQPTPQPTFTAP